MALWKLYENEKLFEIKIYCDGCQQLILIKKCEEDNYFQKKNGNDYCEICSKKFKYRKKKKKVKE